MKKRCVDIAFERDDKTGEPFGLDPLPFQKLGMLCGQDDVLILARKLHDDPLLLLTSIFSVPDPADQFRGQVIVIPVSAFMDDDSLVRADFLEQFPSGGMGRIFPGVDTTLRHLPSITAVNPSADPYLAVMIEQHDPDVAAVRER